MRNSRILGQVSGTLGAKRAIVALCLSGLASATSVSAQSTLMTRQSDFDSRILIGSERPSVSGNAFAHPNRFAMHQSYSVTAMSSRAGSSSSGLYLNTLDYKISDPLRLFVDVGMVTPIHSGASGVNETSGATTTSIVLPRMGLEYKPNDRLTVNLEVVNGSDAYKAYGRGAGYGSSSFYGSRFP
jgi:hypothetical protein